MGGCVGKDAPADVTADDAPVTAAVTAPASEPPVAETIEAGAAPAPAPAAAAAAPIALVREPSQGSTSGVESSGLEELSGIEIGAATLSVAPVQTDAVQLTVTKAVRPKRQATKKKVAMAVGTLARSNKKLLVAQGAAPSHGRVITPKQAKLNRLNSAAGSSMPRAAAAADADGAAAASTTSATGPNFGRWMGHWKGGPVEGRDEFLKAMELNWVLRQVAKILPNNDIDFFMTAEGHLCSHAEQLGKVVEETYKEGGTSEKTMRGITTVTTFTWDGDVLCYTVQKDGAPDEQAESRRWVEPDGKTMRAESKFRKNASKPWAVLQRTWYLDDSPPKGKGKKG